MPHMTPGDVHVNRDLTTIAIAHEKQEGRNFVASRVFPVVTVDKQTDFFYKFGRKSFLQTRAAKRAPGTRTPAAEWNFTRDTFACEVWGLHTKVEDQLRSNADENFRLDQTATELVTEQMLLRREKEFFSNFMTTGIWATDRAGVTGTPTGTQFKRFDEANSDPITVFREERQAFRKRTGLQVNVCVMGADVWDAIIDHSTIVERVKYSQPGFLTQDIVAQALGVGRIEVAWGIESTDDSDEVVADLSPTTDFIGGGGDVWMGYVPSRPSRNRPSAGYTFAWNGYLGASAWGGRIKKYRDEPSASDIVEIEAAYDFKVTAPELGQFLQNAVS